MYVNECGGDLAQFGDGGAIDLCNAAVSRVRIHVRQQRVAYDPIEECTLAGAAAPFGQTPGACFLRVLVALPLASGVFDVGVAIGQIYNFGSRAGPSGGGGGEFAFILVIHLYHVGAAQIDSFRPGDPDEVRITQQPIVVLDGAQIMAPGVAVALRIEGCGIRFADGARHAAILAADIVIQGVSDFAARDVSGKVPNQPVIMWSDGNGGEF